MQAIFSLIVDYRLLALNHPVGYFDVAVGRQGMHVDRIVGGQGHAALVGNPMLVFVGQAFVLGWIAGGEQWPPTFRIDNITTLDPGIKVVHHFKTDLVAAGIFFGLLEYLRHQLEFRRMHQPHIQAKAGH